MATAKTEYEKELRDQPYSTLVYMCESKRVLHTGDKDDLIARLVEAKQAEAEAETKAPPEATETEEASAETEPTEPEVTAAEPEKGPPETEATEPRPPGRRRSPRKT